MSLSRRSLLAATSAGAGALALPRRSRAAAPLRIGFIATLSTPGGYIGEDQRDAFRQAMAEEGGATLGGVPVELAVEDDAFKPATGRQAADRLLARGVRLFTGITFSNILEAVLPAVLSRDGTYVSLNAGPSTLAGKGCNKSYFVVSFQNDTPHTACGLAANALGYQRMVVMAPNYQAGRDGITGFKAGFKGTIVEEIYTRLDQSDFSVELARLRQMQADALYQFHPGGAGINLVKQYAAAGLLTTLPMVLAPFSMDAGMIRATGDAARGLHMASSWSPELDNPANRAFVATFRKTTNRIPSIYAAQAYDTARLIASALKVSGGDIEASGDAFRAALRRADFTSVRGHFAFASNQHPLLDYYAMQIEPDAEGALVPKVGERVAEQLRDVYAGECSLGA